MRPNPAISNVDTKLWIGFGSSLVLLFVLTWAHLSIQLKTAPTVVTATPAMAGVRAERISAAGQAAEYQADAPKTILQLQQFRQTTSIAIRSSEGKEGVASLANLNPAVNIWYVLTITWSGAAEAAYHLENPESASQRLALDGSFPSGIVILKGADRYSCNLFADGSATPLDQARSSQSIFAPLCEGRVYLRNSAKGQRTRLEAATEFLRSEVWGGEKIIDVFHHLLADTHRETGKIHTESQASGIDQNRGNAKISPLPALVDSIYADRVIAPGELGIAPQNSESDGLRPGAWYAASENPGIYVSLLQPNLIDPLLLQSYKTRVNSLDGTEASSLCYLVAFDLDQFNLSYALGTEYPGVGWSPRILPAMRDTHLPGPDGIGTISPLVSTGLISPEDAPATVSAFTGGFKREHGAFRSGELSQTNHGSHYGFVEDGVVFSKLQPGLATILVLDDGQTAMKTWQEKDNELLSRVKYARQNGVPLVEFDEASHSTVPGALVNRWGPGNWSGSEEMKLRTIRAGLALQKRGAKTFLIYAVFSDATPSAMARIFQAYQCQYAFLLDMNALEHTYLAVYRRSGGQLSIDHLLRGMSVVDNSVSGKSLPRFLAYPDNRDFFYITRRKP
jgi:hypothetical protein